MDTAQCRILKDSGRFLVKIPRGLGLMIKININGAHHEKFSFQGGEGGDEQCTQIIYKTKFGDLQNHIHATFTSRIGQQPRLREDHNLIPCMW